MEDVYGVTLDKMLKDSYRKGKYSAIDITAREITEKIFEKPLMLFLHFSSIFPPSITLVNSAGVKQNA